MSPVRNLCDIPLTCISRICNERQFLNHNYILCDGALTDAFKATRDGDEEKLAVYVTSRSPKEINQIDDEQCTLLHYAVKFNRESVVQLLLQNKALTNVKGPDGLTPLHFAAKFGHSVLVEWLLSYGAHVNEKDDKGQTALHYACRKGNSSTVQILSKHGADVNALDEENNSPLHFCALQGSFKVAQLLVQNGANVCAQDISKISPIMLAAAEGCIPIVKLFLETAKVQHRLSEKETLEICDDEGSNSLHFAVQNNQIQLTSIIAECGVDLNNAKNSGFCALHMVCAAGLEEIANILLDRGADVTVVDSNSFTPLHICALHNNYGIAKNLVDHGADVHAKAKDLTCPIHCAAWKGAIEMLSFLLSVGADIGCQDAQMRTPLHCAVESHHEEAVKLFLKDKLVKNFIDLADQNDQTALHYAARNNCSSIINRLLKLGACQSLKDFEEKSSLHIAAENGNELCVKYLLDHSREETNDDDIEGCTPLMLAARQGHVKVIQLLIDNGADVTIRDESRRSALMLAAMNGHAKAVKTLLENNASANDVDKTKNSALHFASKHGHVNCVKVLLQHQAALMKNFQNLTPLDIAMQNKNTKVCAIFFQPNCWKTTMEIRNSDGHSPMKSLIENVPEIAKDVLDNCMEHIGTDINDMDYKIRYIYRYIDPGPVDKSSATERYFALNTMIEARRQVLLEHPVVQTILAQKWKRFSRYFFYVEFLLYCFFVTVLTVYVIENEPPTSELYDSNGCAVHNTSRNNVTKTSQKSHMKRSVVDAEIGLYMFLLLNVLHHIIKLISQGYHYFLHPKVYAFWVLYILTFLFVYPPFTEPCKFQWQMGALSCFLAWCFLVIYLRQFDFFGLHVLMFTKVLISMIKTMFIFIFFIIAFALAFHIMLARQKTFHELHVAIVRIFVMSLGELEFSDIFVESDNKPFTELAEVIFFLFLFLMPIVLMNLMVGIAVGDIDTIKQDAYVEKIKLQVDYIFDLETKLPHWLQQKLYQPYFDFQPNRYKAKPLTKVRKLLFNVDKSNVFMTDEKKSPIQTLLEEYAANLKEVNSKVNQQRDFIQESGIFPLDRSRSATHRRKNTNSTSNISHVSSCGGILDDVKA